MSSARLSATQKLQLEDLYGDQKRSSARVTEMRARVAQQIMPPSEHFRKVLDQMPIYTRPRTGRPCWLSFVCWHRDMFKGSAFRVEAGGAEQLLYFVYACQSPQLVCFCKLAHSAITHRLPDPSCWEATALDDWDHEFALQFGEYCYSDDEGLQHDFDVVQVLLDLVHLPRGSCAADSKWLTLEELRGLVGDVKESEPSEPHEAKASDDGLDNAFAQHPWLLDHITEIGAEWAKRSGTKDASKEKGEASRRHSKSGDHSESSESDVDAEEILDELMAKRAEMADSSAKLVEHFGWSLRGGSWTLPAHNSVAFECFIASPTTSEATAFCHQFGLFRSGNFSIALYGEHNCFLLVRSWVHRMSFLVSL